MLFKSEAHKAGFSNIVKDYEVFSAVKPTTRLAEKSLDALLEMLYDEATGCFTELGYKTVQNYMQDMESDGDLGSVIHAVADITKLTED